jgi:hypothetical protein
MTGDPERGELAMRLVIAMALVAGLAWSIPMVFFGRQQTEYAGALTGASDDPTPGGEGSTDVAGAPAGQRTPVDPIGRANDTMAQATLNNAIRSAQVFYAERGSFDGFGPEVAAQYDPSVTYTSGAAAPGVVSIRGLSPSTVVFVTASEDGAMLCAAANGDAVSFGRTDAQTSLQCTGGWE